MSKEDGRVASLPERLYSIGSDLAGIVDYRGFAFEVRDGGGGDVFVSVGKFGPPGVVEKDGQVLFDLPSVVNGGGKHPYTSLALGKLMETIVNYGQKPSNISEKTLGDPFDAHLVAISGNHLSISFSSFRGLFPGLKITASDWRQKIMNNSASFFEDEKSQREFVGIINVFRHLAEAIRKDNQSQYVRGAR